jgi:hypothetical protein
VKEGGLICIKGREMGGWMDENAALVDGTSMSLDS